jgi:hypothetical protein
MSETSSRQFGLIVAHVLPGFIGLAGITPLFPAVGQWLQPVSQGEAGFGPPIYALMAATTVGMIVSCVRWLVVDHLLEWTGMQKAARGYENLAEKLNAFDYLIEIHYRYYQFYSNTLVAIVWAYGMNRFYETLPLLGMGTDLGVLILCAVLLAGSRDTLTKYRQKLGRVLGPVAEKDSEGDAMTNGADHHAGGGASKPNPESKPEAPVKLPQTESKAAKQPAK